MANRLNALYRDFAGGANNALAGTIGAPVDLVNRYTVNTPNAFMGSDWIRNKLSNLGIGTQGNGVAGFTGGLLGSMAVPGTGLLNAIDTSAQIAQAKTPTEMLLAAGGGLLGEAASAFTKPKVMQEMTAYHGSPHNFDEFKLDKIGTGEGAQAYGHGLYFAENPAVANQYRNVLSGSVKVTGNVTDLEKRAAQMAMTFGDNTPEGAIKWLSKFESKGASHVSPAMSPELVKSVKEKFINGTFARDGAFYHVDIPDSAINNMLDWDKPLSEQPESVRKAFKTAMEDAGVESYTTDGMRVYLGVGAEDGLRGKDVYNKLVQDSRDGAIASGRNSQTTLQESQKAASEYLRALGIPGIRYLDGGSRGSGNGTRNFVVFDDKLVKVLKKE